ncbi:MAG: hypothetical protein ACXVBZ_03665 [Flavisolibacter sp.]
MGLFEWLGDAFNPGPVGDVDAGGQPLFEKSIKKGWAVFFMIIGFGVFGFFVWLILKSNSIYPSILLFIFYLLLAYFLTPRPDTSNVGFAGGLVNDPFRISDDANRLAVFFYLFLLPGKLIVFAMQTAYHLLKKR